MTGLLRGGDSSSPPAGRTFLPVYAFYAGGQTPEVWTKEQIAELDARWGVPIWVNLNDNGNAVGDALKFIAQLDSYGWSKGTAVALDTEDSEQQHYIPEFDKEIMQAGFKLVHYESMDAAVTNPGTSGGKWGAKWPGSPSLPPGYVANQYKNAQENGTHWDASVWSKSVPLHEINPMCSPAEPLGHLMAVIPVLKPGNHGWSVRMLQALLSAALETAPITALEDGIYGPVTEGLVAQWQELYGLGDPAGTAGPDTVASLLTRF